MSVLRKLWQNWNQIFSQDVQSDSSAGREHWRGWYQPQVRLLNIPVQPGHWTVSQKGPRRDAHHKQIVGFLGPNYSCFKVTKNFNQATPINANEITHGSKSMVWAGKKFNPNLRDPKSVPHTPVATLPTNFCLIRIFFCMTHDIFLS